MKALSYLQQLDLLGTSAPFSFRNEWKWRAAVALIVGLAMVQSLRFGVLAHPFTGDSAVYIEEARAVLSGHGLTTRPYSGLGPTEWRPSATFPPGYPLAIAAVARLGISAPTAARLISLFALMGSCLLLAALLREVLGAMPGIVALLGLCSMPCEARFGAMALSDMQYQLCAVGTLYLLVKARPGTRATGWLVGSGLAAGMAWSTRFASYALIIAALLILLLDTRRELRPTLARIGWWLLGLGLVATPLVIFNLRAFGRPLPPYVGAESGSPPSLMASVAEFVRRIGVDFTTLHHELAPSVILSALGLATILVTLTASLIPTRRGAGTRVPWSDLSAHRAKLVLALYAAGYSAMLVLARSRFPWGEVINSRHLFQIYGALWALLIGLAAFVGRASGRARALISFGIVLMICGQLVSFPDDAQRSTTPAAARARLSAMASQVLPSLRSGDFVLACGGSDLSIQYGVDVRAFVPGRPPADVSAVVAASSEGRLAAIILDDLPLALQGACGPVARALAEQTPQGFRRVEDESAGVVSLLPVIRRSG